MRRGCTSYGESSHHVLWLRVDAMPFSDDTHCRAVDGILAEVLGDGLLVLCNTPDDEEHHRLRHALQR